MQNVSTAKDDSFVRTEFNPNRPPPVGERGIRNWLRKHIFCSWLDTLGTVLVIYESVDLPSKS